MPKVMQEIEHKKGKLYYTMGEVAEMFDVNQSLLRYWEQEFDVLRPRRNKKGNRLFTPKDVDTVRTIYHLLKERDMKIDAARRYMAVNRAEADRDAVIVEKLLSIKAMLAEIKQELTVEGLPAEEGDAEPDLRSVQENAAVDRFEGDDGSTAASEDAVAPCAAEQNAAGDGGMDACGPVGQDLSAVRPPFEEQVLFDITPVSAPGGEDGGMPDGYTSAVAAFNGEEVPGADEEPQESVARVQAIEQTLF